MGNLLGGRYRVLGPLGSGILGYVVHVRDEVTGEDKAIKLFRPESVSQSSLGRFEREFEAIAKLAHPHIVRVEQWGLHGDRPFFVMELLEGDALDVFARGVRPASDAPGYDEFARDIAEVFRQLADALSAVHAAGVVHRDVKPENVVVKPGRPPHAKLLDFGHAKDDDHRDLTTSGTVLGTALYLAPEVLAGGPPSPSGDLYALGCVLYEALVGLPPFQGGGPLAVLTAHMSQPAPDPRDADPRVPEALAKLCLALMGKTPDGRPTSAAATAEALSRIV